MILANDTQIPGRTASVIDATTAQRLCALRLNGRLPTRTERVRARAALGLSTAVVTYGAETRQLRLGEVPEWVTETPCSYPSVRPGECQHGLFPADASPAIIETDTLDCEATAGPTDRPAADLDEACAAPAWLESAAASGQPTVLPCALRGPRVIEPPAYMVACEAPVHARRPPLDETIRGAFRCVLPENALALGAADDPAPAAPSSGR